MTTTSTNKVTTLTETVNKHDLYGKHPERYVHLGTYMNGCFLCNYSVLKCTLSSNIMLILVFAVIVFGNVIESLKISSSSQNT